MRGQSAAFRWIGLGTAGVASLALAAGCGEAKRDANEPHGTYTLEVVRARFPARQAIAHDTTLEVTVRNADTRAIPDVAVTLDSLSFQSSYPGLAARERPTWIVNRGPGAIANPPVETQSLHPPGGAGTAFVHTWALGALRPGAEKTFIWHLTPVKAGRQTVHYEIAAGLDGRARARLADGERVRGRLSTTVAPVPPASYVNPQTGVVAAGRQPYGPEGAPAAP